MRINALRALRCRNPQDFPACDLISKKSDGVINLTAKRPVHSTDGILGFAVFSFLGSSALAMITKSASVLSGFSEAVKQSLSFGFDAISIALGTAGLGAVLGQASEKEITNPDF